MLGFFLVKRLYFQDLVTFQSLRAKLDTSLQKHSTRLLEGWQGYRLSLRKMRGMQRQLGIKWAMKSSISVIHTVFHMIPVQLHRFIVVNNEDNKEMP